MDESTLFRDFYHGELQSLWALLLVPFAFVVYRTVRGRPRGAVRRVGGEPSARFVWAYSAIWSVETILDPLCTGPLTRALDLGDHFAGTVIAISFVLLGDLRVFALVFGLAGGAWLRRALGYTLIVPVFAGIVYSVLRFVMDDVPGQVLWLVYELAFVAMATFLATRGLPAALRDADSDADSDANRTELAEVLRSCLGFVAVYYALWATCDLLILAGIDAGWALRAVPNQLYYALWVPFVYARYFTARSVPRHDTSSATQTSR